eukprot:CAMPEP_0182580534 /NCGR_PEP_ID=MMETSP1324-20130603/47377_1 /TAXON_ID=236786 /ORGANISM="Florenciella sp., Strain RCC1587" /LENGTH=33 /DNA_ID= /DNA_START= /DNA_END= /DNA_ORIENTATION=
MGASSSKVGLTGREHSAHNRSLLRGLVGTAVEM